jgi:hypothetical protein
MWLENNKLAPLGANNPDLLEIPPCKTRFLHYENGKPFSAVEMTGAQVTFCKPGDSHEREQLRG